MKLQNLFIDESGFANPKANKNGCYILCGCLINDDNRELLKVKSDQIKFKFWEKTDIVFHSREIGRQMGDFSILKDKEIDKNFKKLLFDFLNKGSYQIFTVIVDNKKATKKNWNSQKVYKETANIMIKNFILALLATNSRGRLVIESASTERDFIYHKTAGFYLSAGISDIGISYEKVQEHLTEISFVTKKNFDIEEQIADLLAYGAKVKFLDKPNEDLSYYDKNILNVFNHKLFAVHPQTGDKKKKFYTKIESYKVLP